MWNLHSGFYHIEEFNIGKRHFAKVMGEDPESFTQENIDIVIT